MTPQNLHNRQKKRIYADAKLCIVWKQSCPVVKTKTKKKPKKKKKKKKTYLGIPVVIPVELVPFQLPVELVCTQLIPFIP